MIENKIYQPFKVKKLYKRSRNTMTWKKIVDDLKSLTTLGRCKMCSSATWKRETKETPTSSYTQIGKNKKQKIRISVLKQWEHSPRKKIFLACTVFWMKKIVFFIWWTVTAIYLKMPCNWGVGLHKHRFHNSLEISLFWRDIFSR